MLERLRNQIGTAGLIVAIVALVAALGGGAYAATGGNSSKATASAKAKQGPRGKTGKAGPAGPAGPAGLQGPAGAKGDPGAPGATGANGTSASAESFSGALHGCTEGGIAVKSAGPETIVCNGKKGVPGTPGDPGPPGPTCDEVTGACLLPAGASETGIWSASTPPGVFQLWTSISFPLRLSEAPAATHFVTFEQAVNEEVPECLGNSLSPKAAPGNLCLYEESLTNLDSPLIDSGVDPTSGASLRFGLLDVGKPARTNGAWAVTACPEGGCLP